MLGPVPIAPNAPVDPRLLSETGVQEFWEGPALQKAVQEFEGVRDPVILTSGGYYYPRGLYYLFETEKGERIGILARDPADLELDDFVVTQEWSEKLKLNDQDVPVGTVFKGGYLKDLGNGNLSRLTVFTARATYSAEKWFFTETINHNVASLARTHEQGRLLRIKDAWTSNGTVYRLEPDSSYFAGQMGYQKLVVTGAMTPGWDLNEEYKRHFTGLSSPFTDAVSIQKEGIDRLQAQTIINYDFTQHLNRYMHGANIYDLPFDGTAGEGPYVGPVLLREAVRRWALYATYAFQQYTMKERILGAGGVVAGNLAVMSLMAGIGMPVAPLVGAGKIGGQLMSHTSAKVIEFMRHQNAMTADERTKELMQENTIGWTTAQIWGGQFNPERRPFLRAIPGERMTEDHHYGRIIFSGLPKHHDGMANIFEPIEGQVTGFHAGAHPAVRIDSPVGLSVEYIGKLRIAVKRKPHPSCTYTLRASIAALFEEAPEGHPFIVLIHDKESGLYKREYLSQESYDELMASIAQKPYAAKKGSNDMPALTLADSSKPKSALGEITARVFGDGAVTAFVQGTEEVAESIAKSLPNILKPRVL